MTNKSRNVVRGIVVASVAALQVGVAGAASDLDVIRPDATLLQFPDVSARHIVFVYANDLWVVPREGGEAQRIASPPGGEVFPRFSPDGQQIAFGGNYEGNRDIYTIPLGGGIAERVTHHPASETLTDWHKDAGLIFYSGGHAGLGRMQQIFTVAPEGGLPEAMPVPYGANGAISSDGRWLAYTPHQRDFRTWKRYRGGMATDIWLFNLRNETAEQVTDWEGTDTFPMWHGSKLYYLSDAGPNHRLNIWSYDPRSKKREQITRFADFDCKWPSMGPSPNGTGEIVFQNGPDIHLLDLRSGKSSAVDIVIPGDRPSLRPKLVDYSEFVASGDISPTGKRVVAEARGDIWSLPAEKGVTRNLTRTDGVAEREPMWSPDGKWITYLSDETGEYELWLTQSDGKGETRQLTDNGGIYRYTSNWSPDSEYIAFADKSGAVHLYSMEDDSVRTIATDRWAQQPQLSWTQDSRWIAMNLSSESGMGAIHIYNVETEELTQVTEPMFSCGSPAFDRAGEYLYFTCDMNFSPSYSSIDSTYIYDDSTVILAAPLNDEVDYPWLPESDEEEWADEDSEDDDADKDAEGGADDDAAAEDVHPMQGTWEGSYTGPEGIFPPGGISFVFTIAVNEDGDLFGSASAEGESTELKELSFDASSGEFSAVTEEDNGMSIQITGTVDGDSMEGTWESPDMGISGEFSATRTSSDNDEDAAGSSSSDEPVEIVFEGLHKRAILLPIEPGVLGGLMVNDGNKLIYRRDADIKLFDISDRDKGEQNVISGVGGVAMSANGKKLLAFRGGGQAAVISAAPGQNMSKRVPTGAMQGSIKPREEWSQILRDAWRIQRDFFYDPGLHGVDWEGVYKRYSSMLPDCTTRDDVSYLIREMIAELNVGHAYYWGGDVEGQPSRNVGMLGCDYELHDGAYRIAKIYEGGVWDADARNPLRRHGADIEEGDYLLAVNGVPVDTDMDPWAAFQGLAGQVVALTIGDEPSLDSETREVLVEPLYGESNLRYRSWIEEKRAYVDYKTDGKVGYIYVPNTGVDGQNDLYRQFYGQIGKEALIIDERWNGGGQIPDRFIELLNRPRLNYWAVRDGKDWPWPADSHQGPKCMLINGLAGSGGDMFPALFRQKGLGPLIGMRTWGGLVGISGNPSLIDGGYTAVPTFGYYEVDGTWGIEGHGVDPDIRVVDDPSRMVDGGDPQLDAAIDWTLEEVARNPYTAPARPAGPDRSGMGIRPEDR